MWRFLKNLEIELPYNEENRIERVTCTPMCIAALFAIARTWKQPRCPSADEWMKKLWYVYTTEYYSAIKRNETVPFAATWVDPEMVILSEVNQTEKTNIM